jgi:hypothetical protein
MTDVPLTRPAKPLAAPAQDDPPLAPTHRRWRRPARLVATVLAVVAALGLLAAWLIPSDEALAKRASEAASEQLGVPVTVGALHWQVLPNLAVEVRDVRTDQPEPILVDRARATLRLASLLRGEVELQRLDVDGATVPQVSLRGLGASNSKAASFHLGKDGVPLAHAHVRELKWISRTGRAVVYEGEADFDAGWRPRSLQVRRPEATPATSLTLTRKGDADQWRTEIQVGGGTADGQVALEIDAEGLVRVSGQLTPKNIEVLSALKAFNRSSPVSGQASGQTQLSAQGLKLGEIVRSLHTHTTFNMAPATLVRFDLDRAVRTLGKEHAGTTRLDTLTGVIDTQNSADGIVARFTGLKGKSGALTASGDAVLARQQVDARAAVDLVDGVVGVPLHVQGPLNALKVSVPGGAVAGAVVGTAVLPGIGTAIGARIGATLGKLFGAGEPEVPARPAKKPAPTAAP